MHVLVYAGLGAAVGFIGGFTVGDGAKGVSDLVKWGVVGAGVYVAGKALKVI